MSYITTVRLLWILIVVVIIAAAKVEVPVTMTTLYLPTNIIIIIAEKILALRLRNSKI